MNRKIFQLIFVLIIVSAFGVIIKNYVDSIVSDINDYKLVLSNEPLKEIYRLDPIVLNLSQEIDIEKFPLNLPVDNNILKFTPEVSGYLYFTNKKTIEFQPNNPLLASQEYTVKFDVEKVFPQINIKPFSFKFSTPQLSYRVNIKHITYTDSTEKSAPYLSGNIVFNDYVDYETKKKIISAKQNFTPLTVNYLPGANNKSIEFIISNIKRSNETEKVSIYWNGKAINSDITDSTLNEIVPTDSFCIVKSQLTYFPKPYLTVFFTDAVSLSNDTDSLLKISELKQYSKTIKNNQIKIQFNDTINGKYTLEISNLLKSDKGYKLNENYKYEFELFKDDYFADFADKSHYKPINKSTSLLKIKALNINNLNVEITHVPNKNMMQFLQVNNLNGIDEIKRVGKTIYSNSYNLNNDINYLPNEINEYELDFIGVDFSKDGLYSFKVSYNDSSIVFNNKSTKLESAKNSKTEFFHNIIFSDINAIAKINTLDSIYIFASSLNSGKPIKNARVEIFDFQQNKQATLLTNSYGVAKTKISVQKVFIRINYNNQTTYLKIDKNINQLPLLESGIKTNKGFLCYIDGLKNEYSPSDSLNIGLLIKKNGKLIQSNELVEIKLQSPNKQHINTQIAKFSSAMLKTYKTKIPYNAANGIWKIIIKNTSTEFHFPFTISNKKKINLPINIQISKNKNTLQLKSNANFLNQKNITTTVELVEENPSSQYPNYTFEQIPKQSKSINSYKSKLNKKGMSTIKLPNWYSTDLDIRIKAKVDFHDNISMAFDTIIYGNSNKKWLGIKSEILNNDSIELQFIVLNNNLTLCTDSSNLLFDLYEANKMQKPITSNNTNIANHFAFKFNKQKHQTNFIVKAKLNETGKIVDHAFHYNSEFVKIPDFKISSSIYNTTDTCIISIDSARKNNILITIENSNQIFASKWISKNTRNSSFSFVITDDMLPGFYVNQTSYNSLNTEQIIKYITVINSDENKVLPLITDIPYDWFADSKTELTISNPNTLPFQYYISLNIDKSPSKSSGNIPYFFKQKQQNQIQNYSSTSLNNSLIKTSANFTKPNFSAKHTMGTIHGPFTINKNQNKKHSFYIPNSQGSLNINIVGFEPQTGKIIELNNQAGIINPINISANQPPYLNAENITTFPITISNNSWQPDTIIIEIYDAKHLDIISPMQHTLIIDKKSSAVYNLTARSKKLSAIGIFSLKAESKNKSITKNFEIPIKPNTHVVYLSDNKYLTPNTQWQKTINPFGIKGTNKALFELSNIPIPQLNKCISNLNENNKIDLESLLNKTFPLIYLNRVSADKNLINANNQKIIKTLSILHEYQLQNGGFTNTKTNRNANSWLSSYTGEFIIAARQNNIQINEGLYNKWMRFQKNEIYQSRFNETRNLQTVFYTIFTLAKVKAITYKEIKNLDLNTESFIDKLYLANTLILLDENRLAKSLLNLQELEQNIDQKNINELSKLLVLSNNILPEKQTISILKKLNLLIENKHNKPTDVAIGLNSILQTISSLNKDKPHHVNYKINNGKLVNHSVQSVLSYIDIPLQFTLSKNIDFSNNNTDTIFLNYWQSGQPQSLYKPNTKLKNLVISNEYYNLNNEKISTKSLTLGQIFKQVIEIKNLSSTSSQDISVTIPIPAGIKIIQSGINAVDINEANTLGKIDLPFVLAKSDKIRFVIVYKATYQGFYNAYALKVMNNNVLNGKAFIKQNNINIK